MSITIHDVAERSGVSIATVSRVVNNNYPVKKETREKVEKAIKELEYKPNEIARSLVLKTTSTIGIVVPGITNIFFPTIVEEINRVLVEEGFIISLFITEGDPNIERNLIGNIISRNIDGMIIIDPSAENLKGNYFEKICKKIPTIIISGNINNKYNFVSYDEEVGTIKAFQYLLELGHKEIVFVRGDRSLSYDLKEKIYKQFIEENNLEYEKIVSVGMGNSLAAVKETERIFVEFLSSEKLGTAIFACNDLMAVGIIKACNKMKIRVPEDMSVIGFDNTLLSSINHPKITTVDLNMKKAGRIAALELINIIKNKSIFTKKIVYETKLIIRESCGNKT